MIKKCSFLLFIILSSLFICNCSSFRNFFPIESITYPAFGNGYNIIIFFKIKFTNGHISSGKIKQKNRAWQRNKNLVIKTINIYDLNNYLIANYSEEYLNKERKKIHVKNELWVAYEGGLVLVPEEYHNSNDWPKYIESIKEN